MTVRLFSCRQCGHLMRLGASRCGQCGLPTPAVNWTIFHLAAMAFLVTAAGTGLILLLR